jgi:hypothetical protein
MYQPIQIKTSVRNSMNHPPLRRALLLVALASLALSPIARAVTPAPDGGYPNENTAEGDDALFSLTTGVNNTAIGFNALYSNTTGIGNTAIGFDALYSNTTGSANTAIGGGLFSNTTGSENTAIGGGLYINTIGGFNTAIGNDALFYNTGSNNTAIGFHALIDQTTGSNNIALGFNAGFYLTTGSNNIDIGNWGAGGESNRIRIGTAGTQRSTLIAGIRGVTTQRPDAVPVVIDSAGQLGTVSSSRRFKKEIKPMDQTSEAVLGLKPVTFHYKSDSKGTPQFGLIAEEVAQVNPDLVVRDEDGKPYTVRYEAVNAMLLNEFLKEHRKVEEQAHKGREQEATIAQLKSAIAQQHKDFQSLTAALKEQAAQIQKVSDQLETQAPAPRVVAND